MDDPIERIAVAFERIAATLETWYSKVYPEKRQPRDAEVTRIPTAEERLKQDQGATGEPIEEWIGPREQDFLAAKTGKQSAESAAPVEDKPKGTGGSGSDH